MGHQRIILGTATFGSLYGIKNSSKLDLSEIEKILGTCDRQNIRYLDTAPGYGDSELIIGKLAMNRFLVNTKIPPWNGLGGFANHVHKSILNSFNNINVDFFDTVYFHKPNDFLKCGIKDVADIINLIDFFKSSGKINKIGFSISTTHELIDIMNLIKPDVVQLPYNILDARFSEMLPNLKAKGIEIHGRSIFLQGLLLADLSFQIKKFPGYSKCFSFLDNFCKLSKLSKLQLCINHAFSNLSIDKFVIGVNSNRDLEDIIYAANNTTKLSHFVPNGVDDFLINPVNWTNL